MAYEPSQSEIDQYGYVRAKIRANNNPRRDLIERVTAPYRKKADLERKKTEREKQRVNASIIAAKKMLAPGEGLYGIAPDATLDDFVSSTVQFYGYAPEELGKLLEAVGHKPSMRELRELVERANTEGERRNTPGLPLIQPLRWRGSWLLFGGGWSQSAWHPKWGGAVVGRLDYWNNSNSAHWRLQALGGL